MVANRQLSAVFAPAIAYITRAEAGEEPLAVWSRGVASIATAAFEMEAVASQSKVEKPAYHVVISWAEGEHPGLDGARRALDAEFEKLGLERAQYVAALHADGSGGMHHLHGVANRVDVESHLAVALERDLEQLREGAREVERDDGWRDASVGAQPSGQSAQARDVEYRSGARSFARFVREEVAPRFQAFVAGGVESWESLRAWFERFTDSVGRAEALRYEAWRGGARVVSEETGHAAPGAALGVPHRELVSRLGPLQQSRDPFNERIARAVGVVAGLGAEGGWESVHAALEREGLALEKRTTGVRVISLDGPAFVGLTKAGLSLRSLEERFGPLHVSAVAATLEAAREVVGRAEAIAVAAALRADPSALVQSLLHTRSSVTIAEIEKVVAQRVAVEELREGVREAALSQMVALQGRFGVRFTTEQVLAEERLGLEAAGELARGSVREISRPGSAALDEQQRRAYTYATSPQSLLKVVTGVPGAGKTFLTSEIAAAYEAAGYRVRAVSVANSAVDVLRRETPLPAQSVAKQIYELDRERPRGAPSPKPTARDALFIDEASTLGTAQGARLLDEWRRAGAPVVVFADHKQFQAVARGDALGLMVRALDGNTVDLEKTRRQKNEWQREATEAVRRGEIRQALTAYKNHGLTHEFESQGEARSALVGRWKALESSGLRTYVETYTNKERRQLNGELREAFRELGGLAGADHVLPTIDGATPFAIGDRVVVRETIRGAGLFNGSVGTVRGVVGSVLELERRDGAHVKIDTTANPGVQHGYCSTEWREQGSTREAELQFLTRQVNQRSLVVGMTRHTDAYGMFYSREEFRKGFESVVYLGERTQSKELAMDLRELGPALDVLDRREVDRAFEPAREKKEREPDRELSVER